MECIIETADVAEIEGITAEDGIENMSATKSEDQTTMDFHVQMRGYTMRDFESLVVHAAAQQLLQGVTFKKQISDEVKAHADKRLNVEIGAVMSDVMKTTVISRGSENVTLAQMIGMESRAYLTQMVDGDGKADSSNYGKKMSRLEWLAQKALRDLFKKEIDAAFALLKTELSVAVSKQIEAAINAQRASIADALGYEIKKSR